MMLHRKCSNDYGSLCSSDLACGLMCKHIYGAEPPQRGARGRTKEKPVIDPSTMSLKSIIKCAYAQERVRMEEERRRKVMHSSYTSTALPHISQHLWASPVLQTSAPLLTSAAYQALQLPQHAMLVGKFARAPRPLQRVPSPSDAWRMGVWLQKAEEDAIHAEGSEPQKTPAKPKSAQPRGMPMRPAPSLTPQLAMVNGKPVIMESSLTVQAQAEDLQRTITVEDNPVST